MHFLNLYKKRSPKIVKTPGLGCSKHDIHKHGVKFILALSQLGLTEGDNAKIRFHAKFILF
jgi:hypothetical protein